MHIVRTHSGVVVVCLISSSLEQGLLGHVVEQSVDPSAASVKLGNDGSHRRVFGVGHFSYLAHGLVQDKHMIGDIYSFGLGKLVTLLEFVSY